eukprot:GHVN01068551.1.p1 GENE.GHVN01068551.1~~GHVN01068551.1.p1  ORF type:complete len:233 (-),score=13.87 GHVN01068551.1:405-1103(-)
MLRSVLRAQFFQVNKSVSIVEVGPRDGLQNESQHVPTATKLELIRKLVAAGLRRVEATAFVNPNKVPQMGDHKEVMAGLPTDTNCTFPVLVPNMKGYEAAKSFGATEVAVFASASESFSQRNTNCSVVLTSCFVADIVRCLARMSHLPDSSLYLKQPCGIISKFVDTFPVLWDAHTKAMLACSKFQHSHGNFYQQVCVAAVPADFVWCSQAALRCPLVTQLEWGHPEKLKHY